MTTSTQHSAETLVSPEIERLRADVDAATLEHAAATAALAALGEGLADEQEALEQVLENAPATEIVAALFQAEDPGARLHVATVAVLRANVKRRAAIHALHKHEFEVLRPTIDAADAALLEAQGHRRVVRQEFARRQSISHSDREVLIVAERRLKECLAAAPGPVS